MTELLQRHVNENINITNNLYSSLLLGLTPAMLGTCWALGVQACLQLLAFLDVQMELQ